MPIYKMKSKTSITDLFSEVNRNDNYIKVCAPMVRYSKLQFRSLVKMYGVDLCFTPMILADSFCQNAKARSNEFTTTKADTPLIVQFAANNASDFCDATEMIYPYADGADLNCGCPQRWAMKDGYGCALLSKPEIVYDLVRNVKNRVPNDFSISVKIRISNDVKETINMSRQLEKCGVTLLTVHGRTSEQKPGDDVNVSALREVCQSIQVPLIANGGIKTLNDANELVESVGCEGVMAASGMLTNPALFAGFNQTPADCVKQWVELKERDRSKVTFQCYHHHLVFMLEKVLDRQQKQIFNHLHSFEAVDQYLYENLITVHDISEVPTDSYVSCEYPQDIISRHSTKCRACGKSSYYCVCKDRYDSGLTDGSFFNSYVKQKEDSELDIFDCTLFDEG